MRRFIAAVSGCLLMLATLTETYIQIHGFYQEHYLWPKEKYGAAVGAIPGRDIVFLVAFSLVALGLAYLSYRLLRYALRPSEAARVPS